jgi:surface antigen
VFETRTPRSGEDRFDPTMAGLSVSPSVVVYPSRRELRAAETRPSKKPVERRTHRRRAEPVKSVRPGRQRTKSLLAAPQKSSGKRHQRRAIVLLATLLAPGLFATVSLPAYAYSPTDLTPASAVLADGTQSLTVLGGQTGTVTRDGFTATSAQQLQTRNVSAARVARITAYNSSGARELGDDYPWPVETIGILSPLGYNYRECVDFVAWRLNRDAGSTSEPFKYVWASLTPLGGNASWWKRNWQLNGWQTSTTPVAGAVAWWPYHVGYVKTVLPNGDVVLEDYNLSNSHQYDIRTVPASSVNLFLYPPPA